ncbi:(-)-5-epieremophilene synthase STPS3-like [Andrographis paniculata]|uniref:(-)-5-epieremophilene synthase STPS3-like n=1 Tax=Andrographis paniculata TaxID=175694 RepID=UPI0021E9463F|nr:(-)-5-epieremophilene synthase STPS3-like [Andrographis paniculata]QJA18347.1 terpene synthase 32 [Andrographis paniculata]
MARNVANNFGKEGANQYRRVVGNYSPSLWGDLFLKYTPDEQLMKEYSKEIEVSKGKVRSMLTTPTSYNDIVKTMDLIDTIERLCLSYHFEDEIKDKLEKFFDLDVDYKNESYDLHTIALHFRLFRAQGYHMSSDVFNKFKDSEGNFQESLKSDARGLLSLYEAAHLRIHGEDILDEALIFATSNLKSIKQTLDSPLKEEVEHALVQPLHMSFPRVEAPKFISIYEKRKQNYNFLIRFAKLDYNLLQELHKKELYEISRWWKELDVPSTLPYARDRVVECYVWAIGTYHEPQYSHCRILLTKIIATISLLDDTYDSYGTTEELNVITEAIQRWDINQIDHVPDYFKSFYKALLELYEQFEEELEESGQSYAVCYAKETLKELARGYNVEAKLFDEECLPPFDRYLSNAIVTSTYYCLSIATLLGTPFATKEHYEWLMTKPKVLVASCIVCRIVDDAATYEVEKEIRGHKATGIGCYVEEKGVSVKEAIDKFYEMDEDAWKDMNEEVLKQSRQSREVLTRILNLARVIEVVYKGTQDGYTLPERVLASHIKSMLVDPIKI